MALIEWGQSKHTTCKNDQYPPNLKNIYSTNETEEIKYLFINLLTIHFILEIWLFLNMKG